MRKRKRDERIIESGGRGGGTGGKIDLQERFLQGVCSLSLEASAILSAGSPVPDGLRQILQDFDGAFPTDTGVGD